MLTATETYFINHYHCPNCDIEWDDTWDCCCNDKCPVCDKEIEPEYSEEIDEVGNVVQLI